MRGVATAPGICVGRVVMQAGPGPVTQRQISNPEHEMNKLNEAFTKAREHVYGLVEKVREELGCEGVSPFEAQQMILDDPDLYTRIEEQVMRKKVNVEWAVQKIVGDYAAIFETMEDPQLKERATDVREIGHQVLLLLQGHEPFADENVLEPSVLVAHDLTPGEMVHVRGGQILGIITEIGGPTSHAAIMARAMEIPTIVGAGAFLNQISEGDIIALDGHTGEFHINPDSETISLYRARMICEQETRVRLKNLIGKPTQMASGKGISLTCNIAAPEDVVAVCRHDGESVGLYRTEYLFLDRDFMPSEDEQFWAYRSVVEAFKDQPVTIRTLDIGGDKRLPYLPVDEEANPVLGFRSLRYCLENPQVFHVQLRALARASAFGKLQVLFPMVTTLEELLRAKEMLKAAYEEVLAEGHPVGPYKVGTLIEVPSAALIADHLAEACDFFSIGTNDLFQYTLSADRMNPLVADLLTPYQPSVLRLIQIAAEHGVRAGISVSMCGEAASVPELVPVWLGMGIQELSMHPAQILAIRDLVGRYKEETLKEILQEALKIPKAEELRDFLHNIHRQSGDCCECISL